MTTKKGSVFGGLIMLMHYSNSSLISMCTVQCLLCPVVVLQGARTLAAVFLCRLLLIAEGPSSNVVILGEPTDKVDNPFIESYPISIYVHVEK